MAYGIQTWDQYGNPNNYGVTPVSVLGYFGVATNQQSGAIAYTVPPGFVVDVLQVNSGQVYTRTRRVIQVSGGTVSLGAAAEDNFGANTYPAVAGFVIVYLRAA